jgi:hypothetical protein
MSSSSSSSTDDKAREVIDKVNRGETGLGSSTFTTEETGQGVVRQTTKGKCGPCNVGKHGECQGRGVCDCDHPSHRYQEQG